ncbi:Protocadherin beta-15 [Orchesella cincta]|uniref:Protocadherin beta-15 n=1 Tax=Orchesella cincta TaxID=48709 RepID=A0A1D2MEA3_ORCCI|nr:Protocadherin beta-15 [Orchesella cincta]
MGNYNPCILSLLKCCLLVLSLLLITKANFIPDFVPNDRTSVLYVPEGQPNGTSIRRLQGVDSNYDTLTFGIKSFTENENPFFVERVSKTEADLRLKMELDRENVSEYWIDLTLVDGRVPYPGKIQFLLVIVQDLNDNSPIFEPFNDTFSIVENSEVPTQVAKLKAKDVDEGPNGEVTYSLELDEDDKDKFNLQ